ncbi:MAG: hypothetical protein PVF58_07375 [Candidatus Methanofastidiosia archaeon]|jgi:Arc/MetJ-type ribon-helix-helix transcriptional regulator
MTKTITVTVDVPDWVDEVKLKEKIYEELEQLVERGEYTSIDECIKEMLQEKFDNFILYLHKKAEREKEKHIPLEEYGKSRGLE